MNHGRRQNQTPSLLLTTTALLFFLLQVTASTATGDQQFRRQYLRQYDLAKSLSPDMVVEELRLRVELVASRGSLIGAASNERRVRGFESALLKRLRDALCPAGKPRPGPQVRPSPIVIDSVTAAASSQQLRTKGSDVADLTALVQLMIDSQAPEHWCTLRSLDEIR